MLKFGVALSEFDGTRSGEGLRGIGKGGRVCGERVGTFVTAMLDVEVAL